MLRLTNNQVTDGNYEAPVRHDIENGAYIEMNDALNLHQDHLLEGLPPGTVLDNIRVPLGLLNITH